MQRNWYFDPKIYFKWNSKIGALINIDNSFSLNFGVNFDFSKYDIRHFYIMASVLELETRGFINKEDSLIFLGFACDQLSLRIEDIHRLKLNRMTRFVNGKEVERVELLVSERERSVSSNWNRVFGAISFGEGRTPQTRSIDSS
jgi:hypothetical protein